MSAQLAADLRAAAHVLERDGWTQGTYHAPDGCHCAEGAIAASIGQHLYSPVESPETPGHLYLAHGWWTAGGPAEWDRRAAAEEAVLSLVSSEPDSVADWNDEPGRTVDEVIAALRAAADRAEADR